MTPNTAKTLRAFFDSFAAGATPFLLLDYDGTLAPFRVDRMKALPWAGVRELLQRIQRQGQTRMAVISGRSAHEIVTLLGMVPPIEIWGLHGAERIYTDGRRELQPEQSVAHRNLDELRAILTRDNLGGLFEDKENGVVIHWRGASPRKAKIIERRTRELFEPLAGTDGLELLEFEAGLELRFGRNKGGAVKQMLQGADPDTPVAYLGDDATDEAAFHAVNGFSPHCLSVLMRRQIRDTEATLWLCPPVELLGFLDAWLQAVENRPRLSKTS